MRATRLVIALFAIGATLGSVGACSHNGQAAGEFETGMITVSVHNDNFLDVDVFSVANGVSTRLGTVSGNGVGRFIVNPSEAAAGISIVATPIGGSGRASTGQLTVSPGQTIDFHVGLILNESTVLIR